MRHGCVAIVETGDVRGIALLAELKGAVDDHRALAEEAAAIAMAKTGVALDECVLLPKGSLPKTPSGKIQRHRCRHMIEADALEPVATVALARV